MRWQCRPRKGACRASPGTSCSQSEPPCGAWRPDGQRAALQACAVPGSIRLLSDRGGTHSPCRRALALKGLGRYRDALSDLACAEVEAPDPKAQAQVHRQLVQQLVELMKRAGS